MKPNAKRAKKSRVVRTDPRVAKLLEQGAALEKQARFNEAAGVYKEAAFAQPDNPVPWRELGKVLRTMDNLTPAKAALLKAVELDPKDVGARLYLGRVHQRLGEGREALAQYEQARWLRPREMRAHLGIAGMHEHLHDEERAIAAVDRGLAIEPDHPLALTLRARLDRRRGDLDGARARLEAVLARDLPNQAKLRAAYELARVLEKQGEHGLAFEAAALGNRLQRDTPEAQGQFNTDFLDLLDKQRAIGRGLFEAMAARERPDDGDPPIFLVGFPRSGTTMTEQVLGAHPLLTVSNEQDLFGFELVRMLGRFRPTMPLADVLGQVRGDELAEMRGRYRAAARALIDREPGATRLVDKFPMNLGMLTFINLVFPEARVIVAHRDPRDVCLSCFMQEFMPNSGMVHFLTLEDTARMYEKMMGLWLHQRDLLTVEFIEVRYEDTTRDLEAQARKLIDFVGLEWHDDITRFHERPTPRYVSTPSYEAVSEPVHTRAQGKWIRQADKLAPILPRLEPFVEALGYTPTSEALGS